MSDQQRINIESTTDEPQSTTPPSNQKTDRYLLHELIMLAIVTTATVVAGYIAFAITERNRAQELEITEKNREQELNLKYVEIAVAVLRADPKEENAARIRPWAARILKKFSPEALTDKEFEQLIEKKVRAEGWEYFGSTGNATVGGSASVGTSTSLERLHHQRPQQAIIPQMPRRSK
ncbi:hypothetical protein [Methylocystis sp.]|uniref:hypothetical protein n=1 Tax=Methylocystis sp. TaxID=1911079 RepID=UPI003D0F9A17